MLFTLLMGMVINIGRHVDDKVKQQNAVDAATFSGGVVLARGMNTLAFSNHLLCDVFALTAFMREARDRNAMALSEDVLGAWTKVGPIFEKSPYQKFTGLGKGIPAKVNAEREMIRTFSEFVGAISELTLPTLEQILQQKLIPQFERTLVMTVPGIAQQVTSEVARRHSTKPASELNKRGQTWGVLWRMNNVQEVGSSDEQDPQQRTLPAADPDPSGPDYNRLPYRELYLKAAIAERERLTYLYLDLWNGHILGLFPSPRYAQMSQFFGLWTIFTHGQVCKLVNEEYPTTNLPYQIRRLQDGLSPDDLMLEIRRSNPPNWSPAKSYLEQNFRFAGVAYRKPLNEMFGKLFQNRLASDAMTSAEVALFVPLPRFSHMHSDGNQQAVAAQSGGNLFGGSLPLDPGGTQQPSGLVDFWVTDNWPKPTDRYVWSLLTQNWAVQIVPTTADNMGKILQTPAQQNAPGMTIPTFGPVGPAELRKVNTH
jgi:hypothetical protein